MDIERGDNLISAQRENYSFWYTRAFTMLTKQNLLLAGNIPNYSQDEIDHIRQGLRHCEQKLNEKFGDLIAPNRKEIASKIQFLGVAEFLPLALSGQLPDSVSDLDDIKNLNYELANVFNIQGIRVDGDEEYIAVQTVYYPAPTFRNPITVDYLSEVVDGEYHRSLYEIDPYTAEIKKLPVPSRLPLIGGFLVSRHEKVHGKLEPKYEKNDQGRVVLRRTGPKEVQYDEQGEIIDVRHAALYEIMTEVLAAYSSHDVNSWMDLWDRYDRFDDQRFRSMDSSDFAAFTITMELCFGDFETGIRALGETYYNCDPDLFFYKLRETMLAGSMDEEDFNKVFAHSCRGTHESFIQALKYVNTKIQNHNQDSKA